MLAPMEHRSPHGAALGPPGSSLHERCCNRLITLAIIEKHSLATGHQPLPMDSNAASNIDAFGKPIRAYIRCFKKFGSKRITSADSGLRRKIQVALRGEARNTNIRGGSNFGL